MDVIYILFGQGQDLDALQMGMRAAALFGLTLVLIRISGRRSFGQRAPFDYVVAILLGATLARALVGASPFVPTVVGALVLVLLHRSLAWLCVRFQALERLVAGQERAIYREGRFIDDQMSAALLTPNDVKESVRQQLGTLDLSEVHIAILERNGRISLIRK